MKKFAAFLILAMIFGTSAAIIFNISSAESLPSEGNALEKTESALSENMPFRKSLSKLMDGIRYLSGVRHFGDIYIGNEGSLLREIPKPTSRTYSAAKNYVIGFAEKNQIKPYFMLVPTASAILRHEIDDFASEDLYNQRSIITRMYSEFEGKVRTTDIYQTLFDRRNEYIYYHTENLPTCLGGYYIYGELCSRLEIEQNTLDSFSVSYSAHGFYGSLATDFLQSYASPDFVSLYEYIGNDYNVIVEHKKANGNASILNGLFVYNEDAFEDKTDMILGGFSPVIEITAAESLGERNSILIFGDESAKSWIPFLVSNFGKITFVDLDSATESLLSKIKTSDYGSVLFAYSTATFTEGIDFEKLEYVK
ncbi:MAG: hypothetical protein IJB66_07750 [Oscillospiraceae bacterium]|nr:hypothetical protein [Oscillospiraceae bacterium]